MSPPSPATAPLPPSMTSDSFELRLATRDDLEAINAIYNHYVPGTAANYDYEPWTIQAREAWFTGRESIHPVTVVTHEGRVVAWGSLGPFRSRIGYRTTAENSIYVHPDFQRRGLGRMILADQIERARALGLHAIVSVIDVLQTGSLALHEKMGFHEAGRFREVGFKLGGWRDAVFMMRVVE